MGDGEEVDGEVGGEVEEGSEKRWVVGMGRRKQDMYLGGMHCLGLCCVAMRYLLYSNWCGYL